MNPPALCRYKYSLRICDCLAAGRMVMTWCDPGSNTRGAGGVFIICLVLLLVGVSAARCRYCCRRCCRTRASGRKLRGQAGHTARPSRDRADGPLLVHVSPTPPSLPPPPPLLTMRPARRLRMRGGALRGASGRGCCPGKDRWPSASAPARPRAAPTTPARFPGLVLRIYFSVAGPAGCSALSPRGDGTRNLLR